MTRMTSIKVLGWATAALFVVISGVGCADPKDAKIKDLAAEIDRLRGDLADREQKLNDAMTRENDSRETIDQLNREMAKIRAGQTAGAKEVDGWLSTANFDMMSLPEQVLFESGKATLTAEGRKRLGQVAGEIKSRFGDRDLYVFGHTDAQPIRKSKWKDNWELSAQRSLTVVRTLHEFGIPYQQLISASCGEYRPNVADKTKPDQPKNRRVEFFAVRKAGSAVTKTNPVE